MIIKTTRGQLSIEQLIKTLKTAFGKIPDPVTRKHQISAQDCLLAGLALFKLKFPSLLQFDQNFRPEKTTRAKNLKKLFLIKHVPSDTYMRQVLDLIDPQELRKAFKKLFTVLQRHKGLADFSYLKKHYLLCIDGTGVFSSDKIQCQNCCQKQHRDGKTTYYHQLLAGAIVHPKQKTVIPLCPEPIQKEDGKSKNDCELNAAKRFIQDFRREHPHLKTIVVQDGLFSRGPYIELLKAHKLSFILVVKPSGNPSLFNNLKGLPLAEVSGETRNKAQKLRSYRLKYINDIPLNDTYGDLLVNYLSYEEWDESGKRSYQNTFITDQKLTSTNVYQLALGGRTRWQIENGVFNTLKNQGYELEHNFGHGHNHLTTVLTQLMYLAFFVDQLEERSSLLFQEALLSAGRKMYLWSDLLGLFKLIDLDSWSMFYGYEIDRNKIRFVGCSSP